MSPNTVSFLAASMEKEMCQWLILLHSGIKTTNRLGESVLVLRPVKGCLSRDFMEVQRSDFQTFKSLLNIWILGPRAWNLDWVRVKWVPGTCILEIVPGDSWTPVHSVLLLDSQSSHTLMQTGLRLFLYWLFFSVSWWLHTKTQPSWCHSAGDTMQASAWSGDCKGDVDSPSSSRWRVWQTFGAIILRWRSQMSM